MASLSLLLFRLSSLCGHLDEKEGTHPHATHNGKMPYQPIPAPPPLSADQAAQNTASTLLAAEKSGPTLQTTINDIAAQSGGWSEYFASRILRLLEAALRAGVPMGNAMRDAYRKSAAAAEKCTTFAKDHPILCTVIALGILAILAPNVLVALGFAEQGIVEGSFAAAWQSMYGGFVEAGSWFSYFQRLGMIMGKSLL